MDVVNYCDLQILKGGNHQRFKKFSDPLNKYC